MGKNMMHTKKNHKRKKISLMLNMMRKLKKLTCTIYTKHVEKTRKLKEKQQDKDQ
jgi:hypothetical protein